MRKLHDTTSKLFPCTECEMKFTSEYALEQHAEVVHDTTVITSKLFPCTECGEQFTAEHAWLKAVQES